MKYSSLQEYFYKLQNVLYLLVLVPLLAFVFLFIFRPEKPTGILEEQSILITGAISFFVVADWLMAFLVFYNKLKSIRKSAGLGLKLEQYYSVAIFYFSMFSFDALLSVGGYFLTDEIIFSIFFGISLIFFLVMWPRPSKVCSDLKLKGAEREMVYYKKMNLS